MATAIQPAAPASTNGLQLVRNEVGKVLKKSETWNNLSDGERRAFASNMVKVASFLARDPGWLDAQVPPGAEATAAAMAPLEDLKDRLAAEALANPVEDLKGRLAKAPGQIGQDFKAGAMQQGVEEFGNLVKTVDFPKFVSGLIQGVFQAIVDASIQQMEAYGELLAATAKSVDQFASDHISDDQAREHVASRFPSLVKIDRTEDGTRRLVQANEEDGGDTKPLQEFARSKDSVDLSSDESEQKFLTAAKLEMARGRQKLMALMVMLGINRIVVTNGRINAKVVFDIRASDYAKRMASAGLTDTAESEAGAAAAAWAPWGAGGGYARTKHMTTVRSSVDDESESKAEMKAKLTGEVRVNFKSETLSPDRMLDALQYEQMNYLASPGGAPGAGRASQAATGPATEANK